MKIAIDIHGVINNAPEFFSAFIKAMYKDGHEIHVVTGSQVTEGLKRELASYGIIYHYLFSILDYQNANGVEITYDENGEPWIDNEMWDKATKSLLKKA